MFGKIKMAALSALLGLGTLGGMPAAAQAGGLYFSFGYDGPVFGTHYDGGHRRYYRHHRPRYGYACTPRHAVKKAYRMGLRHVRVTRVNHRIIRVHGHRYRDHVSVVFARAPHCPVIRVL